MPVKRPELPFSSWSWRRESMPSARLVQKHGPLPASDACEIVRQAALGLQHLADRGLVHRDVKPSNLMIEPSGCVKVLDLGLVLVDAGIATGEGSGSVVGTREYLAPEQADARRVDVRADVYALGAPSTICSPGIPRGGSNPRLPRSASCTRSKEDLSRFRPGRGGAPPPRPTDRRSPGPDCSSRRWRSSAWRLSHYLAA